MADVTLSPMPPERFQPRPVPPLQPVALDDRARDNLRFIRETMERAGSFTAVPGWGGVAMGITALGAAVIASRQRFTRWHGSRPGPAKRLSPSQLRYGPRIRRRAKQAVRFVRPRPEICVCLRAALFSLGTLLTLVLARMGFTTIIPGIWLLLYGTGVVTGGAFSIRLVPLMGLCFMVLGAVATLLSRASWGDVFLASRIWRPSHYFRSGDREEIWRVDLNRFSRASREEKSKRSAVPMRRYGTDRNRRGKPGPRDP
jgi:hypothetical protein